MSEASNSGHTKPIVGRCEIFRLDTTAHLTEEQKTWPVVSLYPVAERYEIIKLDTTAHLTEEQKTWPVVSLYPVAERFELLAPAPALTLKLHLDGSCTNAEDAAIARAITDVVEAASAVERALGGDGLALVGQPKAEPRTVILTLAHLRAEGAAERATALVARLNAEDAAKSEPVRETLRKAGSPIGLVRWELVKSVA